MRLSFNLENIRHLKLRYDDNGRKKHIQLALREKKENEFIAVSSKKDISIKVPQKISIEFVTSDGIYNTQTVLKNVMSDG